MPGMKIARAAAPIVALLALGLAPGASALEPKEEGAPTAKTGRAIVVGSSEELTGIVVPHDLPTEYWFEYGATNLSYQKSEVRKLEATPSTPLSESSKISVRVKGMSANWRYRLVAENKKGKSVGHEMVFEPKKTSSTEKTGTKKATKSAIDLSQPEPVLVGETLVLTGTITGPERANREVVLQASPYPYRATLADVGAPVRTTAVGGFTFRVPHLSTCTHFRVATTSAPLLPASRMVTALAAVRVVFKARHDSRAKGIVRLYGTVSPAEVGAHVYFQVERPLKPKLPSVKPERQGKSEGEKEPAPSFSTKFSTLVKRGTAGISRFSLVVTITDSGLYRAFVVLPPGPVVSGYSGTIGLHAAFSAHKKKKQ